MAIKSKRKGYEIETRTFHDEEGITYLVFRTLEGSYHVFVETEAKSAAKRCGAKGEGNTRKLWSQLWEE